MHNVFQKVRMLHIYICYMLMLICTYVFFFAKYFSNVLFYVPRKMGYSISQQILLTFIFAIGMVFILLFPKSKSRLSQLRERFIKEMLGKRVFFLTDNVLLFIRSNIEKALSDLVQQ